MNQNSFRSWQVSLSGLWFWVTLILTISLLGSIGLGWLVKLSIALIGLFLITPVVAFLGFRWWLKRSLVVEACPVCGYEITGINGTQLRCPSCSEPLRTQKGHFQRLTPPGTVDVQAVEVTSRSED